MKNLLIVLFLLVCGVCFSQEKKRTLDERINTTLDSLSKIYKKKVCGYGWVSYDGIKTTTITYIEKGKEVTKIIKTEIVETPVKKDNQKQNPH